MLSKISAFFRRDFVGIQPQFRQIPPKLSLSITTVLNPNCAALIAATYPPGPPPSIAI